MFLGVQISRASKILLRSLLWDWGEQRSIMLIHTALIVVWSHAVVCCGKQVLVTPVRTLLMRDEHILEDAIWRQICDSWDGLKCRYTLDNRSDHTIDQEGLICVHRLQLNLVLTAVGLLNEVWSLDVLRTILLLLLLNGNKVCDLRGRIIIIVYRRLSASIW
jgi:hypothetical protein